MRIYFFWEIREIGLLELFLKIKDPKCNKSHPQINQIPTRWLSRSFNVAIHVSAWTHLFHFRTSHSIGNHARCDSLGERLTSHSALDGERLRRGAVAATINSSRVKAAKNTYLAANQDVTPQMCTRDTKLSEFSSDVSGQLSIPSSGPVDNGLICRSYLFPPRQTVPTMSNTRQ